jgi:hypothetical protein
MGVGQRAGESPFESDWVSTSGGDALFNDRKSCLNRRFKCLLGSLGSLGLLGFATQATQVTQVTQVTHSHDQRGTKTKKSSDFPSDFREIRTGGSLSRVCCVL